LTASRNQRRRGDGKGGIGRGGVAISGSQGRVVAKVVEAWKNLFHCVLEAVEINPELSWKRNEVI